MTGLTIDKDAARLIVSRNRDAAWICVEAGGGRLSVILDLGEIVRAAAALAAIAQDVVDGAAAPPVDPPADVIAAGS
jgi:hypothetical protein